jgi:hypothetical protein
VVLAGALVALGHLSLMMGMTTHLHQVRSGYRAPARWVRWASPFVTLETMIVGGVVLAGLGVAELAMVVAAWSARDFSRAASILPAILGTLLVSLGAQTVLGGFLMAILEGAEAGFLGRASRTTLEPAPRLADRRLRNAA